MVRSFSQRDGIFAVMDCSDWDDFRTVMREVLEHASGSRTLSDRYVFRGQSCSSWSLESSFDRRHAGAAFAEREKKYKVLIELFRENYEAFGGLSATDTSGMIDDVRSLDFEKIESIAQHHGLSTRLLDWSYSPYVAAFFSVSRVEECRSDKVSVWSLDKEALDGFSKSELVFSRDLYRKNARNLWQMGAFIRNLTSMPDMVDLFRAKSTSYDHAWDAGAPRLIRFDIPKRCEMQILDDLQLMRINSMTIFPGIEGVVGWLKKRM